MLLNEATQWREVNNGIKIISNNRGTLLDRSSRWFPPMFGMFKCNINSHWRNASLHSGGAWVVRDHTGAVLYHARKTFTCSPNLIVAELRCVIWALQSLKDLRFNDVVIALDCQAVLQP